MKATYASRLSAASLDAMSFSSEVTPRWYRLVPDRTEPLQYERMMRDAKKGSFNTLVVGALDRFGRSTRRTRTGAGRTHQSRTRTHTSSGQEDRPPSTRVRRGEGA
jgi:hypothetical protein